MQGLIIVLILSVLVLPLQAQELGQSSRNSFFFEAGGNGLFYSLNYDRIIADHGDWKLSARAGVMYFPHLYNDTRHMAGLPLEFSYLKGRNKHHLELGIGLTFMYDTYMTNYPGGWQQRDIIFLPVARIGYRYQKPDGGLFFKAGFTPMAVFIFELNPTPFSSYFSNPYYEGMLPLPGVAVGWSMRNKENNK